MIETFSLPYRMTEERLYVLLHNFLCPHVDTRQGKIGQNRVVCQVMAPIDSLTIEKGMPSERLSPESFLCMSFVALLKTIFTPFYAVCPGLSK
ncbi:MAG: hypothetical protein CM15mV33_070 [uncultured marine virus]|nr:MAG: hypothetical protein CM15mV33_070 [uncultured marine virus]